MSTNDPIASPANDNDPGKRKEILSYWRKLSADAFDETLQKEVAGALQYISSTSAVWSRVLQGGDPAAATGLALRLKRPSKIGIKTDMAMTVLLHAAFENAGAALVMSHMLQRMPLRRADRTNLSTSWLVHKIWLNSRRRRTK